VETPVRDGTLTRVLQSWRSGASQRSVRARVVLAGSSGLLLLTLLAIGGQVAAARPAAAPIYLPIASFQAVVGEEPSPTPGSSVVTTGAVAPIADPTASPMPTAPALAPTSAATTPAAVPASAPSTAALPSVEPSTSSPSPPPSPAIASAAPTTAPAATIAPAPTVAASVGPAARIFAIGDSVMLGAVLELGHALGRVEIDAEIGRQIATAAQILRERRDAGRLPDVVIIHVGSNGPATSGQLKALMDAVADVPDVFLLNVRIRDEYEGHNNRMLAQIAKSSSNVTFIDWYAATQGRSDLFWKDGMHVRPEGADFYADLIARALHDAGIPTR
jgi:hypothetical protein